MHGFVERDFFRSVAFAAATALEIHPGTAFGPLRVGMTEGQAMDPMQAIGVLGERKPEPI